jgi:hypothetical protein
VELVATNPKATAQNQSFISQNWFDWFGVRGVIVLTDKIGLFSTYFLPDLI